MDRTCLIITIGILVFFTLVGCAHNPKYGTTEWKTRYSGGDGSSYDQAIILRNIYPGEKNIRKSAITYLSHDYGKYKEDWIMSAELVQNKGRHYYNTVINKDGMMRIHIFDVTSLYATPEFLKSMPLKEEEPLPIENEPPVTPGFYNKKHPITIEK